MAPSNNLIGKSEKWLLDEKQSPTAFMALPKTFAELKALREKVQAERRAKRAANADMVRRH